MAEVATIITELNKLLNYVSFISSKLNAEQRKEVQSELTALQNLVSNVTIQDLVVLVDEESQTIVRNAVFADIDSICSLLEPYDKENAEKFARFFVNEDRRASILSRMESPTNVVYVAQRNLELAGVLIGHHVNCETAQPGFRIKVEDVVVAPGHRSAGVGTSLCNAVYNTTKALGGDAVWYSVYALNTLGRRIAEKFGAQPVYTIYETVIAKDDAK